MSAPLFSLLSLATIVLASYGLGRPIVRGLGVGEEDRLSTAVWSLAAGLVVAGMSLAALGLVGLLYPWLIGVLSVTACFWGIGQLVVARGHQGDEATAADESPRVPWPSPPRWMTGGILLVAASACLGSLVSAMAPPTAG
ncbi:MAG: hypothetical protein ABIK89_12645, partial [Planctomycetota bacterium]